MKFQKTLTILFIGLVLCCSSCKKNIFDFDIQNIDAEGEWGLPVYNGTISVGDLLQKLDSTSNIQVGADGTVVLSVEKEIRNLVTMASIFNIGNKQFDTVGTVNITHLPNFEITQVIQFSLNSNNYALHFASIKSGTFSLNFSIAPDYFTYSAQLMTENIMDAQGNPMTVTFNNAQHQKSIDLSNYIIQPNPDGKILISATVVVPNSLSLPQIDYDCHVTLNDLVIGSIIGQVSPFTSHLDGSSNFSFPLNHIQLEGVNFNNAKVTFLCQNSICDINGTINSLFFQKNNGATIPFVSSPVNFSIPFSPMQYLPVKEISVPNIQYNQDIDSIKFNCDFTVNPLGYSAGNIALDDRSSLHLKLKAELPANLSINNAVYKDTVNNALYEQLSSSVVQSIEKITLRLVFANTLPFDFIPTIDFLNSSTGEKYRLNLNNWQLHGSFDGTPIQQQPFYIEITDDDVQKIITYDKIILNFKIGTQGNTVELKDSQYIRAAIGAKIKYSNISMQ